MLSSRRWAFVILVVSAIVGVGSLAWADHGHGGGGGGHGHGGGGGGGHGHSGGSGHSGGHGFSGGSGHVSYGNFGGHSGSGNHWGGGGARYYSGYSGYHNHGWPYSYYRNNYYRPYAYGYFGYPYLYGLSSLYGYGGYPSSYYYGYPSYDYSYPSDYYVNGDDNYYGDAPPPREYVASRPVADVAQVQFRLPDPQATIWVQGQEINSSGTVRQFRSPQLDPSQQYTYAVKAQWNDNGKLVSDERRVKVQANAFAVVDFTQPAQVAPGARRAPLPDLPRPQLRAPGE